tara:strand:- start:1747 stop:2247 length:501 start_codon:yes stop_codon:yes gene_type:complete
MNSNLLNIFNIYKTINNNITKDEIEKYKLQNDYDIKKIKRIKILEITKLFCKFTNITENTLGQVIRAFHTTSPFALMSIVIFFDLKYTIISTSIVIFLLLLFNYYNGCILSYVEHKLCNDNYNICDIVLEINHLEKNHNNRIHITYFIGTFYGILYMLILIYRICF